MFNRLHYDVKEESLVLLFKNQIKLVSKVMLI